MPRATFSRHPLAGPLLLLLGLAVGLGSVVGVAAQAASPAASPAAAGQLAELPSAPGADQAGADPEATLTLNLGEELSSSEL